ncbi:maleylpyruvate isomerase family mycothiol-dependent enzyme [Actinomadura formosensis]|uniref:maleylpyruvate isomerase family mycothiol-dependent enzyme n=1 Tax=Actinomadura formosensis TaxID=60706 RepID=UPI000AEF40B1|nr:maleylpyruvate isomerase family mycothiol-dependent enzyme [Actinomadura formosensis]
MLDPERMKEGLREQTRGFAEAAAGPDPSTRVPTCPEWTLRDLAGHVGQAHRWAAHLIRTGGTEVVDELPRTIPDSPAGWPGWLRDGAADLIAAYEANPDGTVEHAIIGTQPTVMWLRRMLHETAVHRADAAFTAGVPFTPAPDLAADAITEFLGLLTRASATAYKPELAELRGTGQTLCLRPAEPTLPGWLITRTPAGPSWRDEAGDADVTVTGPVRDLLLVFARRLTPDEADVKTTGDASLVRHWLAHTAV